MLKTPLLSPAPTDKVQGMRQSHQLGPWHVNYISAAWSNHGMAGARSSATGQAPGVNLPASNSFGRHVYLSPRSHRVEGLPSPVTCPTSERTGAPPGETAD